MPSYNKIILVGNITRDIELRTLPSGTVTAEFGLATNRHWTDAQGQKREEVMFIDVVAWAKQAETIHQYMSKGRSILIEGRLKFDQWSAQDGSKRSKHFVIVENFQFLGDGQKREQSSLPSHTGPRQGGARSDRLTDTPAGPDPAPAPGPEPAEGNGHALDDYAKPEPVPGLTPQEQRTIDEESKNDVPF